ncbi:MAG: hypothetical protein NWE89_10085 [Candidatus Bathyarchaeota archaeon]|nr:hypothetical protein [Candidatus Bathyarchaeota archaeon]
MQSKRSSYQQCIEVLQAIKVGMTPKEVKKILRLSRYSYKYIMNRLLRNQLVELTENGYELTNKGTNIINYNIPDEKAPKLSR